MSRWGLLLWNMSEPQVGGLASLLAKSLDGNKPPGLQPLTSESIYFSFLGEQIAYLALKES